MMIDHMTLRVRDYERSKAFYTRALAPLGYAVVAELEVPVLGKLCGFGPAGKPALWLMREDDQHRTPTGLHVAFAARDAAAVDAFHRAALAAGGKDDGPPGLRPHYHPGYYGAFVIDLDGQHLEAVAHLAP
jgi:catechol 2,3-dioxygenase-like lactoylglutathione lyase family enzyme